MQIIFFSADMSTINEWKLRDCSYNCISCFDLESLQLTLLDNSPYLIIADYDSVSSEINKLISSATVPKNIIVLERTPEIITGKMLIYKGVKAYGNSKMLLHHYNQMIQTVNNNQVWTYPQLTAALAKGISSPLINKDAKKLIKKRLSSKEQEVIYLILNGFTNDVIAEKLEITIRTVKAHVSSIFSKLHVNDRVSLVLLLK